MGGVEAAQPFMYIAPNTTIVLLKSVPLDNTYTDTIYFANATAQYNYFMSKNPRTFGQQTYQRVGKNKIRLGVKADDVYAYNYLMFRNTAYGNKWFYAFITKSPEYINDNTCEIEYEIDEMQTWFFDYTLEPSYVEREHSATDVVGENIAPEPIDIGPIKCNSVVNTNFFDSYTAVITSAREGES